MSRFWVMIYLTHRFPQRTYAKLGFFLIAWGAFSISAAALICQFGEYRRYQGNVLVFDDFPSRRADEYIGHPRYLTGDAKVIYSPGLKPAIFLKTRLINRTPDHEGSEYFGTPSRMRYQLSETRSEIRGLREYGLPKEKCKFSIGSFRVGEQGSTEAFRLQRRFSYKSLLDNLRIKHDVNRWGKTMISGGASEFHVSLPIFVIGEIANGLNIERYPRPLRYLKRVASNPYSRLSSFGGVAHFLPLTRIDTSSPDSYGYQNDISEDLNKVNELGLEKANQNPSFNGLYSAIFFIVGTFFIFSGFWFFTPLLIFGIQTNRKGAAWVGFLLVIASFVLAFLFLHASASKFMG